MRASIFSLHFLSPWQGRLLPILVPNCLFEFAFPWTSTIIAGEGRYVLVFFKVVSRYPFVAVDSAQRNPVSRATAFSFCKFCPPLRTLNLSLSLHPYQALCLDSFGGRFLRNPNLTHIFQGHACTFPSFKS